MKNYKEVKAIWNVNIRRSTYTRPLDILKEECNKEKRTSLEFCVWFDYQLLSYANLVLKPFDCILELVNDKHIIKKFPANDFRYAVLLFQEFVESNSIANKQKIEDFLIDFPEYRTSKEHVQKPKEKLDFDNIYNYDRVKANKIIFPFFKKINVEKTLIAELIKRGLLAFDDKNNLMFVCKDNLTTYGVVKQGITDKPFMRYFFENDEECLPFMYWSQNLKKVNLEIDITKVVFYDETFHMLQQLSEKVEDGVLYCSLHTKNAGSKVFNNTMLLLSENVQVGFDFKDKEKQKEYVLKLDLNEKPVSKCKGEHNPDLAFIGEDEEESPF